MSDENGNLNNENIQPQDQEAGSRGLPSSVAKNKRQGKYSQKQSVARQKRQMEYFKKRRRVRHVRIFIARVRVFLRLLAIAFLAFCFIYIAKSPGWYLPKNIFDTYPNEHLKFEGNSLTPNANLLAAIRKVEIPNKGVYRVDTKPFEDEIKKISTVKHVYVKRFAFPASLKIVIEEKTPVISIAPNDQVAPLAVFADDGTLIGKEYLMASQTMPTYKVLTFEDYYQWNKKQTDYLQYLAKTAEMYSNERVQYIDLRNPDDVRIKLQTVSVRLGQLNRTVFKRLKKISAILPQTVNLSNNIDYVDLRWEDSAYIKLKNKGGANNNLPQLEEPNN
jgi:cell division septal protein FtsQ